MTAEEYLKEQGIDPYQLIEGIDNKSQFCIDLTDLLNGFIQARSRVHDLKGLYDDDEHQ